MAQSVFLAGLPSAGKSTFIAALWHLIFSQSEEPTALRYVSLDGVEVAHLNALQRLWLEGKPIARTKPAAEKVAEINLVNGSGEAARLRLPDYAGESFRQIWEHRVCPEHVAKAAAEANGLFMLVNVDRIALPRGVAQQARDAGAGAAPNAPIPFDPRKSPTATMMTDVLQVLMGQTPKFDKKVAIGLTAWDTVEEEGITPRDLLAERLPLFSQFISTRLDDARLKVFGITAQGGDYGTQRDQLMRQPPLDRIRVYEGREPSRDLTGPISWLLK